jgi:hypothetical protein
VAKGQILRVRATVDTSEIEDDLTKSDYLEGLDHLDIQSPLREPLGEEFDWGAASADLEGDPALTIALVAVLPLLGGLGLGALASTLLVHP